MDTSGLNIVDGVVTGYAGSASVVSIPEGVVSIGTGAFSSSSTVTSVRMPDSVVRIEADAFCESSQGGIFIGRRGIVVTGEIPASFCQALKTVTFGRNVRFIGENAFCDCRSLSVIDLPEGLERIEDRAFCNTVAKCVTLPKSVRHIGKASFFGCDEITVFDSLDPDVADAKDRRNDSGNDAPNSDLSCALLKPLKNYTHYHGNTEWRSHHISVKSSGTGEMLYRIWVDGNEENFDYRAFMFSAWGRNASFQFTKYDTMFSNIKSGFSRTEMAFCRVEFPFKLQEAMLETYRDHLERCVYIERGARDVIRDIVSKDNLNRLLLLERLGALTQRNRPWFIDEALESDAMQCIAYLRRA